MNDYLEKNLVEKKCIHCKRKILTHQAYAPICGNCELKGGTEEFRSNNKIRCPYCSEMYELLITSTQGTFTKICKKCNNLFDYTIRTETITNIISRELIK